MCSRQRPVYIRQEEGAIDVSLLGQHMVPLLSANLYNLSGVRFCCESRPRVHELAPFGKEGCAEIMPFDAFDSVGHGRLNDKMVEFRRLFGPRLEGCPESVDRQAFIAHATQRHQKRHVGERLTRIPARKHNSAVIELLRELQDFDTTQRERHFVHSIHLHSLRWHGPDPRLHVDLVPFCT